MGRFTKVNGMDSIEFSMEWMTLRWFMIDWIVLGLLFMVRIVLHVIDFDLNVDLLFVY